KRECRQGRDQGRGRLSRDPPGTCVGGKVASRGESRNRRLTAFEGPFWPKLREVCVAIRACPDGGDMSPVEPVELERCSVDRGSAYKGDRVDLPWNLECDLDGCLEGGCLNG